MIRVKFRICSDLRGLSIKSSHRKQTNRQTNGRTSTKRNATFNNIVAADDDNYYYGKYDMGRALLITGSEHPVVTLLSSGN